MHRSLKLLTKFASSNAEKRLLKELAPPTIVKSKTDASVNWISNYASGSVESRYVRRDQAKVAAYVSSQSGCRMGCKFCWLTAQNQTTFDQVDLESFKGQLKLVTNHYQETVTAGGPIASRLNVNFMARGDPLANPHVVTTYTSLYDGFEKIAQDVNLDLKINISSIFPDTIKPWDLTDCFGNRIAYLYYSLYSFDSKFRNKWMPRAIDPELVLDKLARYDLWCKHQFPNRYPITFHWAFIEGENDNVGEVTLLANKLARTGIRAKFNLVRFNPPPGSEYREPSEEKIKDLFGIISERMPRQSKMITRVGPDVYASCGMFAPK